MRIVPEQHEASSSAALGALGLGADSLPERGGRDPASRTGRAHVTLARQHVSVCRHMPHSHVSVIACVGPCHTRMSDTPCVMHARGTLGCQRVSMCGHVRV
eukprot:1570068-Rhodomonas_salina.1